MLLWWWVGAYRVHELTRSVAEAGAPCIDACALLGHFHAHCRAVCYHVRHKTLAASLNVVCWSQVAYPDYAPFVQGQVTLLLSRLPERVP